MELVKAIDKTVVEFAQDRGIDDTALGNWLRADQAEHWVPRRRRAAAVDGGGAG